MKPTLSIIGIAASLSAVLLLTRCNDEADANENEEIAIAQNASLAENETDEVLEMANQVESSLAPGSTGGRSSEWNYPCATVTNNQSAKTITIDFGSGCVGPYGRQRKGKMIITYSGQLNDGTSNRVITFDNYEVNNRQVQGTIELRNISVATDGTIQSTKKLTDLKVTFPNGDSVTYNGERTRKWIEGMRDGDTSNNVFEITGEVQAVSTNGRTFTHAITQPIISDWSCRTAGNFARVSGVVEVERLNGFISRKRTVDYGTGVCDNVITVTVGQRTVQVQVSE